jgi:hypothetical protein
MSGIARDVIMIGKTITGFLAMSALFAVAANFRPTSEEEKRIAGIWQVMGIDTPVRLVYRRDHTMVEMFPEENTKAGWLQFQVGTWQLEGNTIIEETRGLRIGDEVLSDRGRRELTLQEIRSDRLVRAGDRPDLLRANVVRERCRQVVFLFCVILSVSMFFPLLRFGRKVILKGTTPLCLAAAGVCLWASLNLIDELSQTGSLIVSPASLIALRIPAAVSGLAAAGALLFGLLMVWRSRRRISQS